MEIQASVKVVEVDGAAYMIVSVPALNGAGDIEVCRLPASDNVLPLLGLT